MAEECRIDVNILRIEFKPRQHTHTYMYIHTCTYMYIIHVHVCLMIAGSDLYSWDVGVESLHALRVVVTSVTHGSVRGSYCQSTTVIVAGRPVAKLGSLVHHLTASMIERSYVSGHTCM